MSFLRKHLKTTAPYVIIIRNKFERNRRVKIKFNSPGKTIAEALADAGLITPELPCGGKVPSSRPENPKESC